MVLWKRCSFGDGKSFILATYSLCFNSLRRNKVKKQCHMDFITQFQSLEEFLKNGSPLNSSPKYKLHYPNSQTYLYGLPYSSFPPTPRGKSYLNFLNNFLMFFLSFIKIFSHSLLSNHLLFSPLTIILKFIHVMVFSYSFSLLLIIYKYVNIPHCTYYSMDRVASVCEYSFTRPLGPK